MEPPPLLGEKQLAPEARELVVSETEGHLTHVWYLTPSKKRVKAGVGESLVAKHRSPASGDAEEGGPHGQGWPGL